jgi:gas vesicle protein
MKHNYILLGAVTGIALGVLAAPASGKDTRRAIIRRAGYLKGATSQEFRELWQIIREESTIVRDTVTGAAGHVTGAVKDAAQRQSSKASSKSTGDITTPMVAN